MMTIFPSQLARTVVTIKKSRRGSALLITVLLMSLLLFMGIYFLNFSSTEKKISTSQVWGTKAYYLAEAGVHEMIWKLKNDVSLKASFESNPSWTYSFTRSNPFGTGSGSYTVTITNSSQAHGTILATGQMSASDGRVTQRLVKTYVYKALGAGAIGIQDSAQFADGDTNVTLSKINILPVSASTTASLHANGNVRVTGLGSVANINDNLRAVGAYSKSALTTVNVGGGIYDGSGSHNPAPTRLDMPSVDFDSGDSDSLITKATVVYTETQFSNLMKNAGSTLTLPGPITYVAGNVNMDGQPDNIIINGLLVVQGDLVIGKSKTVIIIPTCPKGLVTLVVNEISGQMSGIIVKGSAKMDFCTDTTTIHGVFYTASDLQITSFSDDVDFIGSTLSRNFHIISIWQPIDFIFSSSTVANAFYPTAFSPIISVEHWEEEY